MVIDGLTVTGEDQQRFLLPVVSARVQSMRDELATLGIKTKVRDFGGARTKGIVARLLQWRAEAVARGEPSYRVSAYETGKHPVGGAIDLGITDRPKGMTEAAAYDTLGRIAKKHGLVWGGDFSAPRDIYHVEDPRTRAQLAPLWEKWRSSPEFPRPGIAGKLSAIGGAVGLGAAEHTTGLYIALALACVVAVIIFSRRKK